MMFSSRPSGAGRAAQDHRGRVRYDVEGATLLDDNSKTRRRGRFLGGGVRGFCARLLLRANWAVVSWILAAARKRWFTTSLLAWIAYREYVPSVRSTASFAASASALPPSSSSSSSSFFAPAPVRGGSRGPRAYPFPDAEDAIVVCGHAVFTGADYRAATENDSWFLESYQRSPGQAEALVAQMRRGVEALKANPRALLIFSGGKTRADAGSVSEATSYWQASRALDWFGLDDDRDPLARRAFTEEHARDSLENALFGIARFAELTGKAPRNLTVVGYEFKRERFEKAHRTAVRWPEERFTYLGTPAANAEREVESAASEVVVRAAFAEDPYACGEALGAKRTGRDPFNVGHPYEGSNPDLVGLFRHCGTETFAGKLPW